MVKAPRAWNQAFELVAVGDDDEHFIDQIMGEHAMGLIQSGAASPLDECLYRLADAETIAPQRIRRVWGRKKRGIPRS